MIGLKKHMIISYSIVLILFILDRVTKYYFTGVVDTMVFPGFLSLHYSENTGAACSMFSESTLLLAAISCVFLVLLIVFSHKFEEKTKLYSISYGFIIGGALGNLFDRLAYGYVIDFFKFEFIHFPIFNVADMCLIVGVVLFSYFVLFEYPKYEKTKNTKK